MQEELKGQDENDPYSEAYLRTLPRFMRERHSRTLGMCFFLFFFGWRGRFGFPSLPRL